MATKQSSYSLYVLGGLITLIVGFIAFFTGYGLLALPFVIIFLIVRNKNKPALQAGFIVGAISILMIIPLFIIELMIHPPDEE